LRLSSSYWIVCPKAMLPKVKATRAWLIAEASDDLRRLKQLPYNRCVGAGRLTRRPGLRAKGMSHLSLQPTED
jgi:hypothetical protein